MAPEVPRGRRRRRASEPTPVGDVLSEVARTVGVAPELAVLMTDADAWRRTVGADIAESGSPVRCTDGKLVIAAHDSIGETRLRYAAEVIRQAVNDHIGRDEVRGIVVRRS